VISNYKRILLNIIRRNKTLYIFSKHIYNFISCIFIKKNVFNSKSINYEFYNNYGKLINCIKDSNGSSYYKKSDINIGIITDIYMHNYYKDAVNLIYLTLDNYKKIIDNNKLNIILFISCWKGLDNNDWHGQEKRNKVVEIFNYAKEKEIKSIFQTIEDPSNYEVFIDIAKCSDYIFTSAIEKIDDYKKDTLNDNVFLLDYGINPIIHNPIGFLEKYSIKDKYNFNSVFFAGSWAPRYVKRCEDMKMIFDSIIEDKWNLIIADRNLHIKGYEFPNKYQKYIIPAIEHKELQKVHKLFNWTINLNSIQDSITMCAMRVYEVQALGSLMLSNYALSMTNIFPNIFTIIEKNEIKNIINNYDINKIINMQLKGIRNVYSSHTVYDKLNYIFKCIEINYEFKHKNVHVLCEEKTEEILKSFEDQTYKYKKLYSIDETVLSEIKEGFFIIFETGKKYNCNYISDLINAFKFTDSSYINYVKENEFLNGYNYTENTHTKYSTLYDVSKVSFKDILNNKKINLDGFSIIKEIYANEDHLVKELGVIIPVYNNGIYLRDRCFASLLRSSIFKKMNIYIIDDGSYDIETLNIIKDISTNYNNIYTYFYSEGGSGSASRPRNKGVELCKEKYLTFLDPDNEAINDGYAVLLDDIKNNEVDFAFGTIYKVSNKINTLSFSNENKVINNPKEELINRNFKSQSIQACVINKNLINENDILNPEGALGQDTLFFYELMLNSKKVYHRNLPIHIYYAQRNDSEINSISLNFYNKFFILEKYQVNKLKEYGVLEEYKKRKLDYFIKNWYLEKLKYVKKNDYERSLDIINQIQQLYNWSNYVS